MSQYASQVNLRTKDCAGLAIIDTGASSSVIGNDHVPAVLQKLPAPIPQQVREQPSRVGFRFGNNQVAYSFKQLQIPLIHGKHRIWLLVEVVPKGTPFLLSIKTLKSLGARIDLANSSCYLKTLNRSLPLKEHPNGLFVIDMYDLCHSPEAVFLASSHDIPAPPSLCVGKPAQHADPPRGPGSPPNVVRGGAEQPASALFHDPSSDARRVSAGIGHESDQSIDPRSEEPKGQDQGADTDHREPVHEIHGSHTNEPNSHRDNEWRYVGVRRDGRSTSCHQTRSPPHVQRAQVLLCRHPMHR